MAIIHPVFSDFPLASIGTVRASELIRSLQRGARASSLGCAIGELGRISAKRPIYTYCDRLDLERVILYGSRVGRCTVRSADQSEAARLPLAPRHAPHEGKRRSVCGTAAAFCFSFCSMRQLGFRGQDFEEGVRYWPELAD